MSPIEAICFDLDRTLCAYDRSTDEVLTASFDAVGVEPFFTPAEYGTRFDAFADEVEDIETLRMRCFRTFAEERGLDPEVGVSVAEVYNDQRDPAGVSSLPGAREVVNRATDRYRTALITNGFAPVQRQKLEAIDLADHFDAVVFAGTDTAFKPDPEPFELAVEALGVSPSRSVHVGDSFDHDVVGAKRAGLRAVWINPRDEGGADDRDEPDFIVDGVGSMRPFPWERD